MPQPRRPGAPFEPLPTLQRHFMVEQEAEPFGMFEVARLGRGFERLAAFDHAVEAEGMQKIDGSGWIVPVNGSSQGR
jgi:hypothetical protein